MIVAPRVVCQLYCRAKWSLSGICVGDVPTIRRMADQHSATVVSFVASRATGPPAVHVHLHVSVVYFHGLYICECHNCHTMACKPRTVQAVLVTCLLTHSGNQATEPLAT
jgi:hypothetical protein